MRTFWFLPFYIMTATLMGCSTGEEKAYEDVASSLSLQKLTAFLNKYPDSRYGDLLVRQFTDLCTTDPQPGKCLEMVNDAIPADRRSALIKETPAGVETDISPRERKHQ